MQFANEIATNEIAQYKAGVDALEAKLKEAYAGIDKQNAAISNLVAQRNDLVQKYNDEVKDRNDVVAKYNEPGETSPIRQQKATGQMTAMKRTFARTSARCFRSPKWEMRLRT